MGDLHTTTVRMDADLWGRLRAQSERLGVSKGELIRCALREHLVRVETQDHRLVELERRVEALAEVLALAPLTLRLDRLAQSVADITTLLPPSARKRLRAITAARRSGRDHGDDAQRAA